MYNIKIMLVVSQNIFGGNILNTTIISHGWQQGPECCHITILYIVIEFKVPMHAQSCIPSLWGNTKQLINLNHNVV